MNPVKLLEKNWKNFLICMIILILSSLIAYAGFWVYRGRFITILFMLSPKEELFDVNVEIPSRYKEVSPGEEILVELSLYNIKRIGRVDVAVEYGIEDMEGNEIVSEHTTLAVEVQVSIVRSLDVPFDTRPGNYVLFARARYDNVVGTGKGLFRVITKEELGMERVTMLSLVVIIFVLIIIIVVLSLYTRVMSKFIEKK